MTATEMTARFDEWFSQEYHRLKEQLSLTGAFDEDAFHDAYLSARDEFKKSSDTLPDFRKTYQAQYRRISKRHISEAFAIYNPDTPILNQIPDPDTLQEQTTKEKPNYKWLVYTIRQHVKHNYPQMWVIAWENRNILGMSYADIRDFTGMSYAKCRTNLATINQDVRHTFARAIQ